MGTDPANYVLDLKDSLPPLIAHAPYSIRLESLALKPNLGAILAVEPVEVRVDLGMPSLLWDSRTTGPSNTLGFVHDWQGNQTPGPWIQCGAGTPFNRIAVRLLSLTGVALADLDESALVITIKVDE